jgi:replicative DNA helicase
MPLNGDTHTLPPHNLNAERSLLSALLRQNETIPDAIALVSEKDFYWDAHVKIYAAIVSLYDRGMPADLVLLSEELLQRGHMEDVTYPLLGELWNEAAINAAHYARIVRDKATLRHLMLLGQQMVQNAVDQTGSPDDLLEEAEKAILGIEQARIGNQTKDAEMMAVDFFERVDRRCRPGGTRGLRTGFTDLDDLTSGLQEGELIVVAARPGIGKTSFGLNLAQHAFLREGVPVLFVSLEQSSSELFERLCCYLAKVDSHRLRSGKVSIDEGGKLSDAAERVRKTFRFFVDDTAGLNMLKIAANARAHKLKYGVGLIVVDYLQLVEPDNRKEPRQEQVAGISRRLKTLARELKIPVVALAQLNRNAEDRADKRPRLSDLRESGAIEADADVVLLMHQQEGNPETIELQVAKQRNGMIGDVTLFFRRQFYRFENFTPGEVGPFEDERA